MLLASSLRFVVGQQSLSQGVRGLEQGVRGLATAGDLSSQIPKKPMTPWLAFYTSKLPEHRKESPGVPLSQLMKTISKDWAAMTPAQKDPVVAAFQKETEKWRKQMEAVPDEVKETVKSEKRVKRVAKKTRTAVLELKTMLDKLGKPHRPNPTYILFFKERSGSLPLNPGRGLGGMSRVIAKEWNEISEEKKEVYVRKHKALKADYDIALTQWSSKMEKVGKMEEIRECEARVAALQSELTAAKEM